MQEITIRQRRGNYRTGLLGSWGGAFLTGTGLIHGLTERSPEERWMPTLLCGLIGLAGYAVARWIMLSARHEFLTLGRNGLVFQGVFRSTKVALQDLLEIRWYGEYHPVSCKVIARSVRRVTFFKSYSKRDQLRLVEWFHTSVPTHKQRGWKPIFDVWLQGNPCLPKFCAFFPPPPPTETRTQHWHFIRWLAGRTLIAAVFCGLLFGLGLEFLGDFVKQDLPRKTGVIVIDWTLYGLLVGVVLAAMFFFKGWTDEPEEDCEPTASPKPPA